MQDSGSDSPKGEIGLKLQALLNTRFLEVWNQFLIPNPKNHC